MKWTLRDYAHVFLGVFAICCRPSHASALKSDFLFVNENQVITLYTKNLEILLQMTEKLAAWKLRLEGKVDEMPTGNCDTVDTRSEFQCHIIVTNLLTGFVQNVLETKSETDGPNCHNAALLAVGLTEVREKTSDSAVWDALNSKCKIRSRNETPLPGDYIIIIGSPFLDGENRIAHSFIYLSNDFAFTKNGESRNASYQFDTLENIYNLYGVADRCRSPWKNIEKPTEYEVHCYERVEAYNCDLSN